MKTTTFTFIFLFFIISSCLAFGSDAEEDSTMLIVLKDGSISYSIAKKIFIYETSALPSKDKSDSIEAEKLDIDEILRIKDRFIRNTKSAPAFGFTTSVVWSYFTVQNETDDEWFLEIGSAYQYKVDLYSKNENGKIVHEDAGLHEPFQNRAIKVNLYMLPLHLKKSERKTFYMRVESQTVVNFPLRIATVQKLYETNHVSDIANGLCFGLIIALCLYNLFVFLSIRDRTYLYYVLYILSFAINLSWIKGYFQGIIPINELNLNHSNYPSAAVFIFFCLFTNSFLSIDKYASQLKWMNYIFYFLSGLSVIITMIGFYLFGFNLIMLQVFLMVPYVLLMCGSALKKGYRPAKFYLLGFSFFTLGTLTFVLKDHGILPHNVLTVYSMQLGSAVEALVLSFALADKLNTFKKEKEESQAQALAQSNEFSKQLIKSQEDERRRIAGELHDSIGQSLSIIKNKITLLKKHDPRVEKIDGVNELVSETIQSVRSMSYRLRPFHLDLLGLKQSLLTLAEDVSESAEIEVTVAIDNIDGIFSKESEINVFRIVQEYFNVLAKRTHANHAHISILKENDRICMCFKDDGSVLRAIQEEKTFSIAGIIKRIKILGGHIKIADQSLEATSITIEIPFPIQVFQ